MKGITTGRLLSLSAFALAASHMFKGSASRVYSLFTAPIDSVRKTSTSSVNGQRRKSFGGSVARDKRAAVKARNVVRNKTHHRGRA